MQEPEQIFGVYVQFLLSGFVDHDFIKATLAAKDDYFLHCVRAIDGKVDMLKHLILSSSVWLSSFKVLSPLCPAVVAPCNPFHFFI